MKTKTKDMVTIICYQQKERLERQEAIKKYYEGMLYCDGSEKERYTTIYCQLLEGKKVCSDEF